MEQFSLEKYLENKSRKVVTRRGNPVRIICTDRKHGEDELPIVFLEEIFNGEFLLACTKDGRGDYHYDSQYDLFFADEEEELTEFEKVVQSMLNEPHFQDIEAVKQFSKTLLDLARKELFKDLPKLEKTKDVIDPTIPVMYTNAASMKSYVEYNGYKLCINDAFEKLPKEE